MTLDSENHALRKPASLVDYENDPIFEWIQILTKIMDEHGGIGIAGPQAGINKRIAIVKRRDNTNIVLLNPGFITKTGPFSSKEGCLSTPGRIFKVRRFQYITIVNHEINGSQYIFSSGNKEFSRRIQHEMDHLDGIMCIDKGKEYDLQSKIRKLSR